MNPREAEVTAIVAQAADVYLAVASDVQELHDSSGRDKDLLSYCVNELLQWITPDSPLTAAPYTLVETAARLYDAVKDELYKDGVHKPMIEVFKSMSEVNKPGSKVSQKWSYGGYSFGVWPPGRSDGGKAPDYWDDILIKKVKELSEAYHSGARGEDFKAQTA
jgi:hypothetical protein